MGKYASLLAQKWFGSFHQVFSLFLHYSASALTSQAFNPIFKVLPAEELNGSTHTQLGPLLPRTQIGYMSSLANFLQAAAFATACVLEG